MFKMEGGGNPIGEKIERPGFVEPGDDVEEKDEDDEDFEGDEDDEDEEDDEESDGE